MSAAAAEGSKLLESGDFQKAIVCFSQAIKEHPTSPEFFLRRSMAYHKSKQYPEALKDTETAIIQAVKRGNKDIRAQAQFRRSLALYMLQRTKDAQFCLGLATRDGCKDKAISVWLSKIDDAASVKEIPDYDELDFSENEQLPLEPEALVITAPVPTMTAPPKKPTYEWYQNDNDVIISFYARAVLKERSTVVFHDSSLSVNLLMESGSEFVYDFDTLFSTIDPSESTFRILSSKVEIIMKKKKPQTRWTTLEATEQKPVKIAYPTSSRTGPKDWDTFGATAEDDAKPEGDAAVTQLFQTLYKDADEDTRKAMIKSYTESGGTSLSTDWKSVRKARVEIAPPDGMEAKKYEQ